MKDKKSRIDSNESDSALSLAFANDASSVLAGEKLMADMGNTDKDYTG